MGHRTLTIGIAGGSGCGKSTFCAMLREALGENLRVKIISTDQFFISPLPKMISPATGKEYEDWNAPDAINSNGVVQAIQDAQKDYDIVLVEGISALYFEAFRTLFDLKLFIDLDSDERMYRRIKRNMAIWNCSMEEVADYYLESAKFSENKYYLDTKIYADLVVSGRGDHTLSTDILCAWIVRRLTEPLS